MIIIITVITVIIITVITVIVIIIIIIIIVMIIIIDYSTNLLRVSEIYGNRSKLVGTVPRINLLINTDKYFLSLKNF